MSTKHIGSTTAGGITVTTHLELVSFLAAYGGEISQNDRRELLRFYCKEVAKMSRRKTAKTINYYEPQYERDGYNPPYDDSDSFYPFDEDAAYNYASWEDEYEQFLASDDGKEYSIFNLKRRPGDRYRDDDSDWQAWRELWDNDEGDFDQKPVVEKVRRPTKRFIRQSDGSFKRDSNRRGGQIRMNKTLCFRTEATFDPWLSSSGLIEKRVRSMRYSRYNFKVNRHPKQPKNRYGLSIGNAYLEYLEEVESEQEFNWYNDDWYDDVAIERDIYGFGGSSTCQYHPYDWRSELEDDGYYDTWDDDGTSYRQRFRRSTSSNWSVEGDTCRDVTSDYLNGQSLGDVLVEAIRRRAKSTR